MKKNVFLTAMLAASLAVAAPVAAYAENTDTLNYITDDALVLSDSEWQKLETKAISLSQEYECGIYLFTFGDAKDYGEDVEDAAKSIYDFYDLGYEDSGDGIVFAIDMTERSYFLYGEGDFGQAVMTEQATSYIEDYCLTYLGNNQWNKAADAYLDAAGTVLNAAYNGQDLSTVKVAKQQQKNPLMGYAIAAVIGLIAAFVVTGSMKSSMKTARKAVAAKNYVAEGGIDIRDRQDRYTHTTTTERKIQKSGGGGGNRGGGPQGGTRGGAPGGRPQGGAKGKF